MEFMPMKGLLADALDNGYAVPSFSVCNAETVQAVLETAQRLEAPVIVMVGPAEFSLLSPAIVAGTARSVARDFTVPAALHLDHGESMYRTRECLDAGFTSVMLDLSARPFAENAEALAAVAAMAKPLGVTVEGEIGAVGRADDLTPEGGATAVLTDPDEARNYVDVTGVDALAIAIGNAHGNYTSLPRFDFQRLEAIRARVSVPLVLHGGSGTPDADLRRAISLGIAKVNVATELMRAIRESLVGQWAADPDVWAPKAFAEAMKAMQKVVESWIHRTGAAGRAAKMAVAVEYWSASGRA